MNDHFCLKIIECNKSGIKFRILAIVIILFNAIIIFGQDTNSVKARFSTWYQNKAGAISISFDDACFTQYEYACPILEKYNIKATFSLVGEWTHDQPSNSSEPGSFEIKKMGWQQILELYKKGHEIAAHGYIHQKYDKHLPKDELVKQMKKVKNLIESKIHSQVYTLHYPYSFTTDKIIEAAKESGFLFGRTGMDSINPPNPKNMNYLTSKSILNNETPSAGELQKWISEAKGKWLILLYHHLFTADSKEMQIIRHHNVRHNYSLLPETFEKQIEMISNSEYWVAPVATIGKYIVERNNTKIETIKDRKKIIVNTSTNLDKKIYNQPLTIEIEIPWKKVKIEGSANDGIYKVRNKKLLINVFPEEKVIILKK